MSASAPGEAAQLDLRQQRRSFTLDEIARRAIDLVVERGFDDVTVDEMSAAAGISARTFFRYFPSKSDVLRHHQRFLFNRLVRALELRPANESPAVALRRAFLSTVEMRSADRDRVAGLGRLLMRHDTAHAFGFEGGRIADLLDVLVARGAVCDLDLEAAVGAQLGAAQAAFRHWVGAGGEASLTDAMQRALRCVRFPAVSRPRP